MESNYDEDLSENVFFKVLQRDHVDLFKKATENKWIICVPRMGSMPSYSLKSDDFLSHILVPSKEFPESHFNTLNNKEIKITNRVLIIENKDISEPYSTHILFEETFYTEHLLKYKVLCIEFPLQECSVGIKNESGIKFINTFRDCIDLLWTESSKDVLEKLDDNIHSFLINNIKLEKKGLQVLKDLVGGLYTRCLQITLKDPRLKEKTNMNRYLLDNVKVSVESYVHHGIYRKLMPAITECTAFEDASFNKTVRNLSDLQLRDLDIDTQFECVIPKARSELCKVETCASIIGKVGCLKKTINAISKQDTNTENNLVLAADELLPLLVFLVIKSGLANWIAHLTYMKEFCFFSSTYQANQYNFLVTSLEAAITHIKNDLLVGPSDPESQINYNELSTDENNISYSSIIEFTNNPSLTTLFEMARLGKENEVKNILNAKNNNNNINLNSLNLCHPLCSCEKCERELNKSKYNFLPTVDTCDDRGFTVLHVAAMFGQFQTVDLLLNMGAKPNKADYKGSTPLHYACAKGHQSAVLLLMNDGANVNLQDNDGNTGLHLAVCNGHETCVKAILYFTERINSPFDVNCKNNLGNTPLHYASRWGYSSIVTLLLEYGADPYIENKHKLTPLSCAHSMNISNILTNRDKILDRFNSTLSINIDIKDKISPQFLKKPNKENNTNNNTEDDTTIDTTTEDEELKINRKVERVFRAITYGDERLACFYLGLEPSTHEVHYGFYSDRPCHPLCPCKNNLDECDYKIGELKVANPLNVDVQNSEGVTPLHISSMYGRLEFVKLLLKSGANVNVQTKTTNMTPLHLACQNQKTQIVDILLKTNKCNMNIQDKLGNTALHYACQTNNTKLLILLLNNNPNINISNNNGKTPLDIAKDLMSFSIIKMLNSHQIKITDKV
ncbi:hypothetical protein O3M35_001882 [Rhynocoris fuscipes]|uniref:VPS9 domain-containing protein n=1 Tax=Rhynocoris fuscipes TaxID=488301 RepID=A0AAW1CWU8_9HEMI